MRGDPQAVEIQIVAVGKLKRDAAYLQTGIDDYIKRLRPYAPTRIIEVADEIITPTRPRDRVLTDEGNRILKQVEKAAVVVALAERGQLLDSEALARALQEKSTGAGANPSNGGMPAKAGGPMMFIVGGALGLAPSVLQRADWVLSLSPMTFPHQMVRLLLLEQIYRAFKIQRNEPYHK